MADHLVQLSKTFESGFWNRCNAVCFRDEQNPSRFIHAWRRAIATRLGFSFQAIEHDGKNLPSALLQRSLFSMSSTYWLGELSSKSTAYLAYTGPSKVAFFLS